MRYPSLIGNLQRKYVIGTVAVTSIDLQPGADKIWVVHWAYTYHDDPAAPDVQWLGYDGTNTVYITSTAGLAAGASFHLYASDNTSRPLVINHDFYLRVLYSAMAAGKSGKIVACIDEISGAHPGV